MEVSFHVRRTFEGKHFFWLMGWLIKMSISRIAFYWPNHLFIIMYPLNSMYDLSWIFTKSFTLYNQKYFLFSFMRTKTTFWKVSEHICTLQCQDSLNVVSTSRICRTKMAKLLTNIKKDILWLHIKKEMKMIFMKTPGLVKVRREMNAARIRAILIQNIIHKYQIQNIIHNHKHWIVPNHIANSPLL